MLQSFDCKRFPLFAPKVSLRSGTNFPYRLDDRFRAFEDDLKSLRNGHETVRNVERLETFMLHMTDGPKCHGTFTFMAL
jgi:hypothetical protein